MKQVKILFGQTLIDLAVQELGDASRAFELAVLNGLNISDDLIAGQEILVPEAAREKKAVVLLFTDKANAPASADITGELKTQAEGVEFWTIEKDFIVQ